MTTPLLGHLDPKDREHLTAAMSCLVSHGSIIGTEPSDSETYHWCFANREWLEEIAALLELKLFWDHDQRLVQAVPLRRESLLRLKLDETLVVLTLWYEFDVAVRDRGELPPVRISVEHLNDVLRTRFNALKLPSQSRLRDILGLAQRKNLIRISPEIAFERTTVAILPTVKRVIPFQGIDDWTRFTERYLATTGSARDESDIGDSTEDEP